MTHCPKNPNHSRQPQSSTSSLTSCFNFFFGLSESTSDFRFALGFGFVGAGEDSCTFRWVRMSPRHASSTYQLLVYVHQLGIIHTLSRPKERRKPEDQVNLTVPQHLEKRPTPSNASSTWKRPDQRPPSPRLLRRYATRCQRRIP